MGDVAKSALDMRARSTSVFGLPAASMATASASYIHGSDWPQFTAAEINSAARSNRPALPSSTAEIRSRASLPALALAATDSAEGTLSSSVWPFSADGLPAGRRKALTAARRSRAPRTSSGRPRSFPTATSARATGSVASSAGVG